METKIKYVHTYVVTFFFLFFFLSFHPWGGGGGGGGRIACVRATVLRKTKKGFLF